MCQPGRTATPSRALGSLSTRDSVRTPSQCSISTPAPRRRPAAAARAPGQANPSRLLSRTLAASKPGSWRVTRAQAAARPHAKASTGSSPLPRWWAKTPVHTWLGLGLGGGRRPRCTPG
eukprot:scaffold17831_cov70-Phaeocystis_antarctica.AAC.6